MRACCRARSFFLRCLRSRPRPVARAVFSFTASKCSQQFTRPPGLRTFNLPSSAKHGERFRSADLDVLCSQQWQPKCASWWTTSAASGRAIRGLLDATQEHMSGAVSNWYLGIARAQAHHRSNPGCRRSVCAHHCVCALLQLHNRLCLGALGLLDGLGHLHCLRAEQTQVSIQFTALIVHHNGRRLGRSYNI